MGEGKFGNLDQVPVQPSSFPGAASVLPQITWWSVSEFDEMKQTVFKLHGPVRADQRGTHSKGKIK